MPSNDEIHIASSCDEKFLPHFCAMIYSANVQNKNCIFYLFAHNISQESIKKTTKWSETNNLKLVFIDATDFIIETIANTKKDLYPIASYIRIVMPTHLPNLSKLLYIDSDCIINQDLTELWNINITNHIIAGVLDSKPTATDILAISENSDFYINSGVLLFNLNTWRDEDLSNKCIDFLKKSSNLNTPDQTAINFVTKNRKLIINKKFNISPSQILYGKARVNPVIIHFMAKEKPWLDSNLPFSKKYWSSLERTPFIDLVHKSRSKKILCKKPIKFILNIIALRPKYITAIIRALRLN